MDVVEKIAFTSSRVTVKKDSFIFAFLETWHSNCNNHANLETSMKKYSFEIWSW